MPERVGVLTAVAGIAVMAMRWIIGYERTFVADQRQAIFDQRYEIAELRDEIAELRDGLRAAQAETDDCIRQHQVARARIERLESALSNGGTNES